MRRIITILSIIMLSAVLANEVYAESKNNNELNISTKNHIEEQSVEYNGSTLLVSSEQVAKINNNVEEKSMQKSADNINKENKEMVFVLGGVLLAFTVAAVYEINHD